MSERSELDLQRYLAGKLPDDERQAFERELLESDDVAADVYDELVIHQALHHVRRARAAHHRPGTRGLLPRRWVVPSAIAAVLVVMAVLWPTDRIDEPLVFRSLGPLEAVQPVGEIESLPNRFVWSADPAAGSYHFELFDATSSAVVSKTVVDTFVVIDAPVPARGYWTVTSLNEVQMATRSGRPVWYEVTDR